MAWRRAAGRLLEHWGLRVVLRVLFPIVSGAVINGLRDALNARTESYTSNVRVQAKLPRESSRVKRMVTVRDDGGPQVGPVQQHGFGFNVWAEDSVISEKLARMCMAVLPSLADGSPIVRVGSLSGPFEVVDEATDLVVVGGDTLRHFYFSAQVWSRGGGL